MISRISLGTAQFGQEYGIANARGKVSKNEVVEIFDYARRVGINCIDTAFVYGVSESVIGGYLRENPSNFKIVSKLPPLEQYRPGKVAELLGQSLEHLGIKQLYGYLLHRFNDILVNGKIWDDLAHIKKSGKVEKIGFSLYSPEELVLLLDKEIEFDIVQVPYSIFDRRFEKQFSLLNRDSDRASTRPGYCPE